MLFTLDLIFVFTLKFISLYIFYHHDDVISRNVLDGAPCCRFSFIYKIKRITRVSPRGIPRETYSIGMIDVFVSNLKLTEDGFHKFSEGYGIYVVLQYLM